MEKVTASRRAVGLGTFAFLLWLSWLGCQGAIESTTGPEEGGEEEVTGSLAQVILVPPGVTLSAGRTQQFYAYGRLSEGDSVGVGVTFSATGGTITSEGLYTAGGTPGTYEVVVQESGGALSDTSGVVITGGGSTGGNIYTWGFENPGPPRNDRFGWFRDVGSPSNPPDEIQVVNEAGQGAGGSDWYATNPNVRTSTAWGQMFLRLSDVGNPTYEELYVRFAVQVKGGFAREGFKTLRFFTGVPRTLAYVTIEASGSMHFTLDNPDLGGPFTDTPGRSVISPNQWYWIEVRFDANPGGQASWDVWVNDELVMSHVIAGTNSSNLVIETIAIPQSGPDLGSDVDMWAQFDEIAISTERIGIP